MGKLDKRVVLVTGAQRGLGSAIVREMAMEGATCIVNYPGPAEEEPANRLVRELEERGISVVAMAADVTRTAEVAAMVQQIRQRYGRLDVLVNNAGVNPLKIMEMHFFEKFFNLISFM